eukprot:SAG31_NODE_977_length_10615_cov_93.546786_6_plen_65_part_00
MLAISRMIHVVRVVLDLYLEHRLRVETLDVVRDLGLQLPKWVAEESADLRFDVIQIDVGDDVVS